MKTLPSSKTTAPDGRTPGGRTPEGTALPERAGAYRLLELLGEGGMGSVYLAERDDEVHHRRVAVKVLRTGFEETALAQRFQDERDILSRLQHPNIARLLDGGEMDDGRPYLVMELVEGVRLDRYCDAQRLGVQGRIALFRKVCEAVQYAHQRFIVHRDLKPSNILVTAEGEPKLLDFGIAKLIGSEPQAMVTTRTQTGAAPMTPAYASPEQLLGKPVSTASDTYSLGVMLHELLTGQRPFSTEGTLGMLLKTADDTPPSRPSTLIHRSLDDLAAVADARGTEPEKLRRQLRGDLDNIVLESLVREPTKRYASAEHLARDLAAYLEGRPVSAREATFYYRSVKFLRRNRWWTAAAVASMGLFIAFAMALVDQHAQTLVESRRAQATADFLTGLFLDDDPDQQRLGTDAGARATGSELTARRLLERGIVAIADAVQDQPAVRADLLETMGSSYSSLGEPTLAEPLITEALEIRNTLHRGDAHPDIVESKLSLCKIASILSDWPRAESQCRGALTMTRRLGRGYAGFEAASLEADSLEGLGMIQASRQRWDEANPLLEESIALTRQLDDPMQLGNRLTSLATVIKDFEPTQAVAHVQEALEVLQRRYGDRHPLVAKAWTELGGLQSQLGESVEAMESLRRAEDTLRQIYGSHPFLAETLYAMGQEYIAQGEHAAAEAKCRESLEMFRRHHGDDHHTVANVLARLAVIHSKLGQMDLAETRARRALAIQRNKLGNDHPSTLTTLGVLAEILSSLYRDREAEKLYGEIYEISLATRGAEDRLTARASQNYAAFLLEVGKAAEAVPRFEHALQVYEGIYGRQHRDVGMILFNLARAHNVIEDNEVAEVLLLESAEILTATVGDRYPELIPVYQQLGKLWLRQERFEKAEGVARQAMVIVDEKLPAGHIREREVRFVLGRSLYQQGRYDEALAEIQWVFETQRDDRGLQNGGTQAILGKLIEVHEAAGQAEEADALRGLQVHR